MSLLRLLVYSFIFVYTAACSTSPYVWSIGASTIRGVTPALSNEDAYSTLELFDSKLVSYSSAGFLMPTYPYQSLRPALKNEVAHIVPINQEDILWSNNSVRGVVTLIVGGKNMEFDGTSDKR